MRYIQLEDWKKPDALQGLFVEVYHNVGGKENSRQSLAVPTYFPTNPQAEILVFERISTGYINEIVFWDFATLGQWKSDSPATYTQRLYADSDYFYPRCDYRFWTRDGLDSDDEIFSEHIIEDDIPF